ncbi:MAG: pyruvate kinase [Proteobacteria bacterium]|nr:pyruvate kinase [Pseudomonadota bacterium]
MKDASPQNRPVGVQLNHQPKHTKIVATLGPASTSPDILKEMIRSGVNLFRLNFSHGDFSSHERAAKMVRQCSEEIGGYVGLIGDLPGPKVRIGSFLKQSSVTLVEGQRFAIDPQHDPNLGNGEIVGVNYSNLASDCQSGQRLVLDDGALELEIEKISGSKLTTIVIRGGELKSKKGLNLLGGGLSVEALTPRDQDFIRRARELDIDYLAVSFPRTGEDMMAVRRGLDAASPGNEIKLISKIERAEVMASDEALDDVINHSDAVMVARGDLGVEVGDAELIGMQKRIIRRARELNRAVITATQMMESMVENSTPTRAEVFDVANAVLDYTDAVMLSAETATGKYPIEVVQAMRDIIIGAEKESLKIRSSRQNSSMEFSQVDESIALSAMFLANNLSSLKAILCLTDSGNTPLWMSRIRSGIPIYAMSRCTNTLRRVCLYRGVFSLSNSSESADLHEVVTEAKEYIGKERNLQPGDTILYTCGGRLGPAMTNSIRILEI